MFEPNLNKKYDASGRRLAPATPRQNTKYFALFFDIPLPILLKL